MFTPAPPTVTSTMSYPIVGIDGICQGSLERGSSLLDGAWGRRGLLGQEVEGEGLGGGFKGGGSGRHGRGGGDGLCAVLQFSLMIKKDGRKVLMLSQKRVYRKYVVTSWYMYIKSPENG